MPGDPNVCSIMVCYMYEKGSYTFPAFGSLFMIDLFVAAQKYEVVGLGDAAAECLREDLELYWDDWRPEKVMDVVEKVYKETERFSILRAQLLIALRTRREFKDTLQSELVRERLMGLPSFLLDVTGFL